nr:hypothetical protein CFP56_21024 [Quercus suber]
MESSYHPYAEHEQFRSNILIASKFVESVIFRKVTCECTIARHRVRPSGPRQYRTGATVRQPICSRNDPSTVAVVAVLLFDDCTTRPVLPPHEV